MPSKPVLRVHTIYQDGSWVNELGLASPPISRHESMQDAIESGRDYAQMRSTEHLVHDRDGLVADRRNYRRSQRR
jgi:hypothetical protein